MRVNTSYIKRKPWVALGTKQRERGGWGTIISTSRVPNGVAAGYANTSHYIEGGKKEARLKKKKLKKSGGGGGGGGGWDENKQTKKHKKTSKKKKEKKKGKREDGKNKIKNKIKCSW